MQSRLYLPKLENSPQTILEYLATHFAHIPMHVWQQRALQCRITLTDGRTVAMDTPYQHGVTVIYFRDVPQEPALHLEEAIVYRDSRILVADKPHGMVVTPAGDHVERSLLHRLQQRTGLMSLSPVHRLDRDTAGIVLFTIDAAVRGSYHQVFSNRMVQREYRCIARIEAVPEQKQWHVANCMEAGEPWYRRRIAADSEGECNAITHIELLDFRNGRGLFRLRPETGKKHQLRVHMASLGFPIEGDLLYPEICERQEDGRPLQLLATQLSFNDPLSGQPRHFSSAQSLLWPVE